MVIQDIIEIVRSAILRRLSGCDKRTYSSHRGKWGGLNFKDFLIAIVFLGPMIAASLLPAWIAPYDPMAQSGIALTPPSAAHWFGVDDLGRDVFSMVVAGARSALIVGMLSAILSIAIGTCIGLLAGFIGGLTDIVLMRLAEFINILPRFLVAMLVATLFGPSLAGLCMIIGFMSWPGLSRLVRASAISTKQKEYILAAHALGVAPLDIMKRHLLPASSRPALALFAPIAISAILLEAALGYLGLSDSSSISWGDLLRNGQNFYAHGWWLAVFPGLALVQTCLGLAFISLHAFEH